MSVSNTERSSKHSDTTDRPDPEGRTAGFANGLVGGTVALLLSFLPLSEVLGGAIAGYLDHDAGRNGFLAGVVAGAVAFLPYLLVGAYLAATPGIALPGPELALSRELVVAGATAVAFVYAVGSGVLGSLLGGYINARR